MTRESLEQIAREIVAQYHGGPAGRPALIEDIVQALEDARRLALEEAAKVIDDRLKWIGNDRDCQRFKRTAKLIRALAGWE